VVYGDIGTIRSRLRDASSRRTGSRDPNNVYGILSLIVWSLTWW